ncbi:HSP20-like chaperone [Polychytrium aggregatum]|uniref:HSP20-like chaperone n=1 Tax=Polychytrium aggregatum TaxID=110093 RepID=UPI0022FE3CFE|nr:HSP20-like chaperone [Polychytrium aggregatum]KAI9197326.1 HSP20-like chaperone [Polychytrium aggregatum]
MYSILDRGVLLDPFARHKQSLRRTRADDDDYVDLVMLDGDDEHDDDEIDEDRDIDGDDEAEELDDDEEIEEEDDDDEDDDLVEDEDEDDGLDLEAEVDVVNKKNSVIVKAEMPGIKKKDVRVFIADDVLTIEGQQSFKDSYTRNGVRHVEEAFAVYQRQVQLPPNTDPASVTGKMKHGLLELHMNKTKALPAPTQRRPRYLLSH